MKLQKIVIAAGIGCSLAGCAVGPWGGIAVGNPIKALTELHAAKVRRVEQEKKEAEEAAKPKVYGPPQVVYRIDKNRYITMEKYTNCKDGWLYYHNDVTKEVSQIPAPKGILNYQGELIWLQKDDDFRVYPLVRSDNAPCSDNVRGCSSSFSYSTDGGISFKILNYSVGDASDSKDYQVIIDNGSLYVRDKSNPRVEYPTKFSLDDNRELFDVYESQIDKSVYDDLLAIGVPDEVLNKKNLRDLNGSILMANYHYTQEQYFNLRMAIGKLYREVDVTYDNVKIPNSYAGDREITCDFTKLPNQLTGEE